MEGSKLTSVRFDLATHTMAMELAEANFPKPSGSGHLAMLLRTLIREAYHHPERFDLQPPRPVQTPYSQTITRNKQG
jgi:hypothetical protein